MAILHKKDRESYAQKGQKCDLSEKSAYKMAGAGAKIRIFQRNQKGEIFPMKRVKYACLSQTIYFTLSDKLPHQEAVKQALEERSRCLEEMERKGVQYRADKQYQMEDGTPVLEVRKQYNNYLTGQYLD